MTKTKEELEKAYFHIINEYSESYNSDDFYKDLSSFRDLCLRIGFEAGRDWITKNNCPPYELTLYNSSLEEFLVSISREE